MQSSHRIYKSNKQISSSEPSLIPVTDNPEAFREYSSGGQAESLMRQSKRRADELIRLAEQKCAKIIEGAKAEAGQAIEDEKKKASEAGYKDGAQKGYKAGLEAGKQDSAEKSMEIIEEAKEVLKAAHMESRSYIEKAEKEIIELSVKIAESIIKKELQLDDSIIVGVAKAALAEVRNRVQIIIRAGKKETMVLQDNLEELKELCPNGVFTILRDENVSSGACIIETDIHVIDASVDRQLENVKRVLTEVGRRSDQ